jgi:hypothetical protein
MGVDYFSAQFFLVAASAHSWTVEPRGCGRWEVTAVHAGVDHPTVPRRRPPAPRWGTLSPILATPTPGSPSWRRHAVSPPRQAPDRPAAGDHQPLRRAVAAGRLPAAAAVALDGIQQVRRLGLARPDEPVLAANATEALVALGRWDQAEQVS